MLLLPTAAIQSTENKAPRLSGPTQWLCAFASGWTNNTSVFQLYWKPFCCRSVTACVPLLRQCRGASMCLRIHWWFQEHVPPQLPIEPTWKCAGSCLWAYGRTEIQACRASLLYRSTREYKAEQGPSMNNYIHPCINGVAGSYRSLMMYDITMKMWKLYFPESHSYMKSWLPLRIKEPEILLFARKAWKVEQLKKHKLECRALLIWGDWLFWSVCYCLQGTLQMCELSQSCKYSLTQENVPCCTFFTYSKSKREVRNSPKTTRLTCKTI